MSLSATPTMQRMNDDRIRFAQIEPSLDDGSYPVKRVLGEQLKVTATIFRDGSEILGAAVRYHHERDREYHHTTLKHVGQDRWEASFELAELGIYHFSIVAWTDAFATWQERLRTKWETGDRDIKLDFQLGAALLRSMADRVPRGTPRVPLMQAALLLGDPHHPVDESIIIALSPRLAELSADFPDPAQLVTTEKTYSVCVDPARAGFAAWYELFPRSQSLVPGKHGTLRDVLRRLPELRELGFDVVLLTPIHPIGLTNRRGKNGSTEAEPNDVGSPWAVGNWQGGHDSIETALGTLDDFRMLLGAALAHDLDIALELTLNCSPDHPYLQQCPHWFKQRVDGSYEFAEYGPGLETDAYSFDFDIADWPSLWQEVLRVLVFWIEQGVRIFNIHSPQSKPIGLWDWIFNQIKRKYPDVTILSGAFAKPAMSRELAKIGFSQSITDFPSMQTKQQLIDHVNSVTSRNIAQYYRPHFFTNTPDLLPQVLQDGGKPAFAIRLILAATLSPLYGIYSGFEFYENQSFGDGSESYLHSEKFELLQRPADMPGSLKPLIKLLNQTRRTHPALQQLHNVVFHFTANAQVLCYSKCTSDKGDRLIVVVNLDPHRVQETIVELSLEPLGLQPDQSFLVHDLLTNQTWNWKGARNYVRIDPHIAPAHVMIVRVPVFKDPTPADEQIEQHNIATISLPHASTTNDTDVEMPALPAEQNNQEVAR